MKLGEKHMRLVHVNNDVEGTRWHAVARGGTEGKTVSRRTSISTTSADSAGGI
jgi:hypothetical protein